MIYRNNLILYIKYQSIKVIVSELWSTVGPSPTFVIDRYLSVSMIEDTIYVEGTPKILFVKIFSFATPTKLITSFTRNDPPYTFTFLYLPSTLPMSHLT